ncbi:S9 family peptidase [Shewanella sp. C32]|uniref:S9 family peptidase n=1 Tax=Shewanella electrica TaxID=515560 RepID=A0ABT2FNB7_9GAMM|nr:S9 family peptidase [Shewanella electrica]MCH1926402.1 S9 family peptidase [Shewanella electrica]MCS4557827.1 S9 family peptidase [Shewanella electrica]
MRNTTLFALFLLFSSTCVWAQTPAELFSEGSQYSAMKISPGGDYISVKMKDKDGLQKLAIFSTENMKPKHVVFFAGNAQVGDYAWVNDERVVVTKEYLKGWSDSPLYYGEIMAVNADGSKPTYLVGYQGSVASIGTRIKTHETELRATSSILDPLRNDADNMLIDALPWSGSTRLDYDRRHDVYKVNVYTGARTKLLTTPIALPKYIVDDSGDIRFIGGTDRNNEDHIFMRKGEDWVNLEKLGLAGFSPISLTTDPNVIYATEAENGEPTSVYQVNVTNGEKQLVVNDAKVSPSHFWINQQTKSLFAVEFEPGYPYYAFVNMEDPRTKQLKDLLQSLAGYQVRIVSETRDASKLIIVAFDSFTPGRYYLYDITHNTLKLLADAQANINPNKMAEVKPIKITARDGIELQGFLTLPEGKEAKNLPLIVNPHGGPHGIRDYWQFDSQNQFLASLGYAVLQVNYRGSGGYGEAFERAGYRKWGSDIQHDIIDATKAMIDQGFANKDKICIVGGSFGGYSALMSAELAPDLFQCAVGIAGVYDLKMMFEEGDVQRYDYGNAYLHTVLGDDKALLDAMSPSKHVNQLKAKLMLVHGGNDERAPIDQLEALTDALDDIKYPYQTLIMDDEGHGFYDNKHRAQMYQQMADFLQQSLQ